MIYFFFFFDLAVHFFFFFKQKTAYEIMPSLVGSEMCIRDSLYTNGFQNALTEYGDYADPQVLLHSQKDIAQTPFVARSLW